MNKSEFLVEFTDTFQGEANYCWVRRYKVYATSLKQALTLAKKAYFNVLPRHKLSDYGDMIRADFTGMCVCAFVLYADEYTFEHINFEEIGV